MAFRIPSGKEDPYWDFFINRAPFDPNNLLGEAIRKAPDGNIYPARSEVHSPDITAGFVKELGRFWGAAETGIVRLQPGIPMGEGEPYPSAVLFVVQADYDPRQALGVGGQLPVLKGAYVSFEMAAYFRELGFRATRLDGEEVERLAQAAGLGKVDGQGRLVSPRVRPHAYVPDAVITDLPLAADGEASWPPTS